MQSYHFNYAGYKTMSSTIPFVIFIAVLEGEGGNLMKWFSSDQIKANLVYVSALAVTRSG